MRTRSTYEDGEIPSTPDISCPKGGRQTARATLTRRIAKWIALGMLAGAVAALGLASGAILLKGSSNHAAYHRVKVGMTRAEIERILADEPGHAWDDGIGWSVNYFSQRRLWREDYESLSVRFDSDTSRNLTAHIEDN